ncbi:MAG: cadmium-translocating P-type ATPase [Clostridia bacterium]|nr:cadmium-translocating P-type ATPase [Clostridia bacterium]
MAEHKHDECHDCCCCHEHEHEHDDCCTCHTHDDDCGCGCGHDHEHEESGAAAWIRLGVAFALLITAVVVSMLGAPVFVSLPLYILAYLVAGYEVLLDAVHGIFKGDIFGENFLMSIASIGALIIGEYAEGCAVMLLFELGERLQSMAVAKSRGSIRKILEMRSDSVTLVKGESEVVAKPDEAHIGDIFIVKPGEKVALDGEIISGDGDIDMSSLTGESLPVSKHVGDSLLAGSISIDGTLRVRVTEEYENSTVSKILEMIEHAKSKKSRTESFISRFAKVYTPIVCALAAAVAFVPPLLGIGDFGTWIYRGLCALAASCPCALVISVPLGFFGGLGAASRDGILIKGSNYLEALSKVDSAAFDKTGTLTSGSFTYIGEENVKDADKLHFALAVCEKYSTHPIALAATERFGALASGLEIADSHAIRGRGVSAVINGDTYLCGNAALMEEKGVAYIKATLGGSVVYAAKNGEFLGSVTFADTVKEDTKEALDKLAALGICDTAMLTGDKKEIAEEVAASLGISEVYAELLPADKSNVLEEIKSHGKRIVYVGDGINDAPVLALADVGVAMGGIGSSAALEAADAVIMGDSLAKLPAAIRIARRTMTIVRQNIVFSLVVKIAIVLLAAVGFANLWVAVFGDVGVCLIAVLNALRVLRKK